MSTDEPFLPGDIVTRDGSDEQLVLGPGPHDDWFGAYLKVRCTKAPASGWCQVGEEEDNLPGRYVLVRRGMPDIIAAYRDVSGEVSGE